MKRLYLFALALLVSAGSAFAATQVDEYYAYGSGTYGQFGGAGFTPEQACNAYINSYNSFPYSNEYKFHGIRTFVATPPVYFCQFVQKQKISQTWGTNVVEIRLNQRKVDSPCSAGRFMRFSGVSVAWMNEKTGFHVPHPPPSPFCYQGCKYNVSRENDLSRGVSQKVGAIEWKQIVDKYSGTTDGNVCEGNPPSAPPPPASPPGMNCGYMAGETVCMGKDATYVCRDINGKKECLPTSDINKGQVCGMVQGKYMCFPIGDQDKLCSPTGEPPATEGGEIPMKCMSKEEMFENDPDDPAKKKTEGDKGGTTDSDKNSGTTDGSSAKEQGKEWGQKYEHGLGGIWMAKQKEMQNTKLVDSAKKLMPQGNAGECPNWEIDANFGGSMDFGSHNIAPPCSVWPMLRAITLALAAIFAFRLIFGGA